MFLRHDVTYMFVMCVRVYIYVCVCVPVSVFLFVFVPKEYDMSLFFT